MAGLSRPSVVPGISVGGFNFTDIKNLIVLHAAQGTGAGKVNATFRKQGASAGYAVTAAKTLTIYAVRFGKYGTAAAGYQFSLAQSDNDVGFDSNTALTNPVYINGSTTLPAISVSAISGMGFMEIAVNFQVAATKFLSIAIADVINTNSYVAYGYET